MSTKVENLTPTKVTLEIEVEASVVAGEIEKAFKKAASQVVIPGFRKGRAPRKLLERYINKESVQREALESLIPTSYLHALDQEKIEPLTYPTLEVVKFTDGEPLIFKATLERKPDIDVREYKEVELQVTKGVATEKQIEEALEQARQQRAILVPIEERPLQMNDVAVIDYEGNVEGKSFPGNSASGYFLEMKEGSAPPHFVEQLVGMKKGEAREVKVKLPPEVLGLKPELSESAGEKEGNAQKTEAPEQEPVAQAASQEKEAVFTVTLREVKEKKLPSLDDQFAQEVSKLSTLEELKEQIRKQTQAYFDQQAKTEAATQLINKVASSTTFPLAESLVEDKITSLARDMETLIRQRGGTLDQHLEATRQDLKAFRESLRGDAEKLVRADLTLEEIARLEGLTVLEEEVEREIASYARSVGKTPHEVKQILEERGTLGYVARSLLRNKAAELIFSHAKITYLEKKAEEV